jgi:putative ribosome biogenesis GTPase RsgA
LATVTKFTKDYLLYMLGEVEKILENDGDLVDAYNIDQSAYRDWGTYHLSDKEILSGFKEFKAFVNQCKFRNCAHINEPNCAVKNALEAGNAYRDWGTYRELHQRNAARIFRQMEFN